MQLKKHQTKYAKGYKDKELVAHEGGTGKTVCASVWNRDGRDRNALVVCPKRVVKKWGKELEKWGTRATVKSKEEFKKEIAEILKGDWSSITVDEADEFASPLFVKGRSALSTALYSFVQEFPDLPILLLSATPIRSNPWNLHTLLCFKGKYIDWKKWREHFFELKKLPYLPYPAWIPKRDWRKRIRPVLEKNADIVLLSECVDELPPELEPEFVEIEHEKFVDNPEWSPSAAFVAEHRHEQEGKAKEIVQIGREFRKVLVVAHYREQCEELEKALSKDRKTYMVMGGIKDQESILKEANEDCDECYLIVQASLGAGFDADTFSCVAFASMSYSVRDWVQMKFRVRRIHNLHPVQHWYLFGGRCDKEVYQHIKLGKEFVPSEWKR